MAKIWTKRTINALPSPPASYGPKNHPDPRFPSLSIVVTPAGAKSWSLKYRVAGRQRRLTLGRWPAIDIETARELAREALTRVAKGGDPHAEKAAARRGEVVDGFLPLLAQYVETWTRPRNSSWIDGARKLGMNLNWYVELQLKEGKDVPLKWHLVDGGVAKRWEKASVHQITKQDIVKALDAAVKLQGPIAANRLLAGLSGFFTWCVGRGILAASPAKGIPAPAEENVRERELSNTELALIYRAAAAIPAPYSTLAQLWLLLGQRRTETTLMARSQLRLGGADEGFAGQIWRIPAPVAKNGIAHDVPLPRLALDLLEQLPNRGDLILASPRTGGPISGFGTIKDRIEEQLKGAITEDWRIHDFRRTMATGIQRLGFAPYIAEVTINHKIPAAAKSSIPYLRYAYLREKAEALEAWSRHVAKLAG